MVPDSEHHLLSQEVPHNYARVASGNRLFTAGEQHAVLAASYSAYFPFVALQIRVAFLAYGFNDYN